MSSMLEQAIVDAQALREAALKNAEQTLIEKFAPQIKDAVESLLEGEVAEPKKKVSYEGKNYTLHEIEDGKATIVREGEKPFVVSESELSEEIDEALLQEEDAAAGMATNTSAAIEAPFAGSPVTDPEQKVEFSVDVENPVYEFDLEALKAELSSGAPEEEKEGPADITADLGLGGEEEGDEEADEGDEDILAGLELQEGLEEDEDKLVEEIMNLMNEMESGEDLLEEELVVDMGEVKDGTFRSDKETLEYYKEMQDAKDTAEAKATEKDEENKKLKKENEKLQETIKKFKHKNKQYKDAVEKLSQKVNETLLSNAKLLYSNKTLSDASLNERQKTKIVEAIAKAKTPEEAKNLCETLNATVTSGNPKKAPRTLSESVQRKSNLSGILPRRKQDDHNETHSFADHMKKLAGIK